VAEPGRFEAAVAAAVLASARERRELLQSVAEVARVVFVAEAVSIARLDAPARERVFEAVAGQGADRLVGARFAAGEGVAGRVTRTGEAVVGDDLSHEPAFARDVAVETGYTPDAIMAAPLVRDGRTVGVLSVLDRGATGREPAQELELVLAFARHAALVLEAGEAARHAAGALEGAGGDVAAVARVAHRLDVLPVDRREAGLGLLEALARVLS
jgi:GAF domain-containing protein